MRNRVATVWVSNDENMPLMGRISRIAIILSITTSGSH